MVGQVVVSADVASLCPDADLVGLGVHRLRDLSAAEELWQVGSERFPALRTLDVARNNLPVERTPLVGRQGEIAEVVAALRRRRLVSLLGVVGGMGKTRLAVATAAEVADGFADGLWFVDLVPVGDASGVAEAVAAAMGLRLGGSDVVRRFG